MLNTFLQEHGSKPFVWGQNDCALFAGAWLDLFTDGAATRPFWGAYTTKRECDAFLAAHGGLVAVFGGGVCDAGLRPVQNPTRGSVGVVRLPNGPEICGICLGEMWAIKTRKCFSVGRADVIQSWGFS